MTVVDVRIGVSFLAQEANTNSSIRIPGNAISDVYCAFWKRKDYDDVTNVQLRCSNGCFGPVEFELPTAILKDHELHAKVEQTWEFENDKCITTNAFNNLTVDVHHVDCKETVSGSRESNFDQSFNIVRKCQLKYDNY